MATGTTHRYNFGFHVLNNDPGHAELAVPAGQNAVGFSAIEGRYDSTTGLIDIPNSSETTYYVQGHIIGVEI